MKTKTTIKLIASAWRKRIWGFYDLQNPFNHQTCWIMEKTEKEVPVLDGDGFEATIVKITTKHKVPLPHADIPTLFKLNPRILK